MVRCVHLQSAPWGQVVRKSPASRVAPTTSVLLEELRVLVPPGKSLVSRCVEWTVSAIVPEVTGSYWQAMEKAEPGGGAISIERKVLYRNANTVAHYASIPISIHNPSGQPVTLPAGLEVRLSLAFE